MTCAAGMFIIMAQLVVSGAKPETPTFKHTKLICSDIVYFYEVDNYKYPGVYMKNGKNYLTNYENSVILQEDVSKQCKR